MIEDAWHILQSLPNDNNIDAHFTSNFIHSTLSEQSLTAQRNYYPQKCRASLPLTLAIVRCCHSRSSLTRRIAAFNIDNNVNGANEKMAILPWLSAFLSAHKGSLLARSTVHMCTHRLHLSNETAPTKQKQYLDETVNCDNNKSPLIYCTNV